MTEKHRPLRGQKDTRRVSSRILACHRVATDESIVAGHQPLGKGHVNLAQSGVDLRVLSDLAGNADIRTMDRSYLGPVRTRELVTAVKEAEGE